MILVIAIPIYFTTSGSSTSSSTLYWIRSIVTIVLLLFTMLLLFGPKFYQVYRTKRRLRYGNIVVTRPWDMTINDGDFNRQKERFISRPLWKNEPASHLNPSTSLYSRSHQYMDSRLREGPSRSNRSPGEDTTSIHADSLDQSPTTLDSLSDSYHVTLDDSELRPLVAAKSESSNSSARGFSFSSLSSPSHSLQPSPPPPPPPLSPPSTLPSPLVPYRRSSTRNSPVSDSDSDSTFKTSES